MWAEDTVIEVDDASVSCDYGISMRQSAGTIANSVFTVNCNGIDINSRKSVSNVDYSIEVIANEIETGDGAPITVFQGGLATIVATAMEGAAD